MEILNKGFLAALLIFGVASASCAEEARISSFGLLNSNEAPPIIGPQQAQDLLNIDVTPDGKSVKKRSGYGTYKTLGSGLPIRGGYHFYDSSGNDVQLWGSGTNLYGIVADGTPTVLVSSATTGATWDCTDTQGFAYCVNSARDALIKTNGATITWFTSPLGTMVASTPDRLLVAGLNSGPSTISISGSNALTNFVAGNLVTDPFTEPINAPGSKLTHIEYACGRWLWWKDQSFGYILGTDQTNLKIITVSNSIGTQDNSSAIDPSGDIWFRGQEGHIYQYDCSNVTKMSRDITPQIQTSARRVSALFQQTSQTDFQTGTIVQTNGLSTTINGGDVVPSSFSITDTTTADFSSNTLTNLQISPSGNAVVISTNDTNFTSGNASFLGSGWSSVADTTYNNCGTIHANGGDNIAQALSYGAAGFSLVATIVDLETSATVASVTIAYADNACAWTARTLTIPSTYYRRKANVNFYSSTDSNARLVSAIPFILNGNSMVFYTASDVKGSARTLLVDGSASNVVINSGISTITTGNIVSKAYNTGVGNNYVSVSYNGTVDQLTPAFSIQDSTSATGAWADVGTLANVSYPCRQFIRYTSTFTVTGSSSAASTIDDVTLLARSSGTYYSPVQNKPNLSTWDAFNATTQSNGGANSFFMRSSTNSFTVLSTTPSWTATTPGNVITIATGTYFQVRDDITITASTQTPVLSDFTVNWFEGSAADKAYAVYYRDAVWFGIAYGSGQSTNNYVFRFDLLNKGWGLYNIGIGGFLAQNDNLYFGSASNDKVYRFGSSTDDAGSTINSYWKSRDFTSADPYMQTALTNIDLVARKNQNQSLMVNYALNGSTTTTSYTVSLSTTTEANIFHRKLIPPGKNGYTFNVQFGDTSSAAAWEVLGVRVTYDSLPYRPSN